MSKILSVGDLETDPFELHTVPEPFCAGFMNADKYLSVWDERKGQCIFRWVDALSKEREPHVIYFHNGGKFDFWYLLPYLHSDLRIVNGRIIQAYLGIHELRDSFAIMPFALAKYSKQEMDYAKLHRRVRNDNRVEILEYLKSDCVNLLALVTAFHSEFGDNLTVGGTAMKQIKQRHKFGLAPLQMDEKLRSRFFFGGRNQCFKTGIVKQPIKIYDVNSMYPKVMRDYLHPGNGNMEVSRKVQKNTMFVVAKGRNFGAFPIRKPTGGLDFSTETGEYYTTIHEWQAALDTGCFEPTEVVKTYGFDTLVCFDEFVNDFYATRKKAVETGDKIRSLLFKFVLNSGYGKFAQNPENYYDWKITQPICPDDMLQSPWEPAHIEQGGKYVIWKAPSKLKSRYNVAIGASITGAARAVLLRGIAKSIDPIYCDTDSIICRDIPGIETHDSELGAWKVEGTGDRAAICGKKLYAIFDGETCIKKAHKGVSSVMVTGGTLRKIEGYDIMAIAGGAIVQTHNPVPAFKLDGRSMFVDRTIRSTF